MIDIIQEIFQSLRRNKLRTTLTGLSVSWGIFILIILLGAGNGLKNGVSSNFSDRATNSVTLWSGTTSMPHEGLKSGRNLQFSEKEINAIENQLTESRLVTARISRTQNISNGAEYGSYQIRGVMPDYQNIEHLIINPKDGRFVNQLDINSNNKVIVLDKKIADLLFKKGNAIGKDVKVGDLIFKIIGINSKKEQWGGPNAYIPFSTAQIIFNPSKKFNQITFTVDGLETKEENDKFDEKLRTVMGNMLSFNPKDRQAIWVNNSQADYIETQKIFGGITIFVSIIGLLTLIAGIVGVSNIMLVSVKERTKEIGIRKAIGAPPSSILSSIIFESLMITAIFGYFGMMMGIGLTEVVNFFMEQSVATQGDEMQMSVFKNPTVNISYALFATGILIVSGIIAGYMPARNAVKIKPIEAMRKD